MVARRFYCCHERCHDEEDADLVPTRRHSCWLRGVPWLTSRGRRRFAHCYRFGGVALTTGSLTMKEKNGGLTVAAKFTVDMDGVVGPRFFGVRADRKQRIMKAGSSMVQRWRHRDAS